MKFCRKFAPAFISVAFASVLYAQEEVEFVNAFKGEWFAFDPVYASSGNICSLTLDDGGQGNGTYGIEASGCGAPIRDLAGWRIQEGQILLLGKDGSVVATLGGSQRRITGVIVGAPRDAIIIERGAGDGNSARLNQAVSRHGCVFRGFTDQCISGDNLVGPNFTDDGERVIEMIVNLNIRAQPRHDAPVIGTIPRSTKITVDECLLASDGVWCAARFGEAIGWLARTGLRRNEWPVATFVPADSS